MYFNTNSSIHIYNIVMLHLHVNTVKSLKRNVVYICFCFKITNPLATG